VTTNVASNTATIARNSFWFGLERGIEFAVSVFASIAVARGLGPERLGHFAYFTWLTNMVARLGDLGISNATRKYMAEYWGRGELGVSRAVFHFTIRIQTIFAVVITLAGVVTVVTFAHPQSRLVLVLLVLSILPSMINSVPSQANVAIENLAANVPGSLVSIGVYAAAVVLSLSLGWGVVGLAAGMLAMRALEFVVRLTPVMGWMRRLPQMSLPAPLMRRMLSFSGHSLVLLVLTTVVLDRSEMLFLRHWNNDPRQVAFYSVAFGLSQSILMLPWILGNAIGASVMAQFGRDETGLARMASDAVRYLGLVTLPLYLGAAALSGPAVRLAYGPQYIEAVPVLALAAVLAIPRAFLLPVQHLLQATENQGFLVRWLLLTAVLDLLLAWILIPRHGALAAALVNGIAQSFAVVGLWVRSVRLFRLQLPFRFLARVAISSLVMAGLVLVLGRGVPPAAAICTGVPFGIVVFSLMLRLTGSLERQDRRRLLQLRPQIPSRVQPWFDRGMAILTPAAETKPSRG